MQTKPKVLCSHAVIVNLLNQVFIASVTTTWYKLQLLSWFVTLAFDYLQEAEVTQYVANYVYRCAAFSWNSAHSEREVITYLFKDLTDVERV